MEASFENPLRIKHTDVRGGRVRLIFCPSSLHRLSFAIESPLTSPHFLMLLPTQQIFHCIVEYAWMWEPRWHIADYVQLSSLSHLILLILRSLTAFHSGLWSGPTSWNLPSRGLTVSLTIKLLGPERDQDGGNSNWILLGLYSWRYQNVK